MRRESDRIRASAARRQQKSQILLPAARFGAQGGDGGKSEPGKQRLAKRVKVAAPSDGQPKGKRLSVSSVISMPFDILYEVSELQLALTAQRLNFRMNRFLARLNRGT